MTPFDLDPKSVLSSDKAASLPIVLADLESLGPEDKDTALAQARLSICHSIVAPQIKPLIIQGMGEAYGTIQLLLGGYEQAPDPEAWSAELDTIIENWSDTTIRNAIGLDAQGEAVHLLPADIPGFNAWAETHATAWAPQIAEHIFKDLTDAKLLSAAGIVWKDIAGTVVPGSGVTAAETGPSMSEDLAVAVAIFAPLRDLGYTTVEALEGGLAAQLADLQSSEEAMRGSALTALGANAEQVAAFNRLTAAGHGLGYVLQSVVGDTVPEVVHTTKGAKPTGEKPRKRNAEVTEVNHIVAQIMAFNQLKIADLAERVNLSKTGFSNIAKLKTGWEPQSAEELAGLRGLVDEMAQLAASADATLQAYGA